MGRKGPAVGEVAELDSRWQGGKGLEDLGVPIGIELDARCQGSRGRRSACRGRRRPWCGVGVIKGEGSRAFRPLTVSPDPNQTAKDLVGFTKLQLSIHQTQFVASSSLLCAFENLSVRSSRNSRILPAEAQLNLLNRINWGWGAGQCLFRESKEGKNGQLGSYLPELNGASSKHVL
ncbi:hypothetical protein CRG98_034504 [Punica granatum]|uniref:Uncharacterized protein n=1 Tax=Punica granatum TaxID=22663 RepID=A0A2I0IN64_PUNGR|nr:hypothetical protein CRG98_034504 [Punica granatum]